MWRNWYTRALEVRMAERLWRFKSSHPHQQVKLACKVDEAPAKSDLVMYHRMFISHDV